MLLHSIQKSPFFIVLFDESLNKVLQNEQIDNQLRFWNESSVQAKTRYFDSQFLLRPSANNLLEPLTAAIKDLSQEKLIQLSIDGPSTNWFVLDKVVKLGCCGLHVLHGAFKAAFQATDLSLDKILKAMWNLFHDSPARRETYKGITK